LAADESQRVFFPTLPQDIHDLEVIPALEQDSRFVPATEQFFVRVYVGSFNNTDNLRIFFRGIAVAKEAFVNIGIQANQLDSKLRLQLG